MLGCNRCLNNYIFPEMNDDAIRNPQPAAHSLLSRLSLILFGLLFGFLLLELLIRLLGGLLLPPNLQLALAVRDVVAEQERLYQEDAYLGKVLRPGLDTTLTLPGEYSYHLQTADLGLGGPGFRETEVEKPAYAVAAGDSFTFGLGVGEQDSWVQRLQIELGKEVVNLGQPGFGPVRTARTYERYGSTFQPEIVLWLLVPNDLEDGLIFNGMSAPSSRQADSLDRVFSFLRPLSRLALILEFSLGRGPLSWAGGYTTRTISEQMLFFHPELLARQIDLTDETIEMGWWISRNAIVETVERVRGEGGEFVLILAPVRERAYIHLLSDNPASEPYNTDPLFDRYRSLGQEIGFPVLDLTPAFAEHAQAGEILYFQTDGHWNEQGNALAAKTIAEFLGQRHLN